MGCGGLHRGRKPSTLGRMAEGIARFLTPQELQRLGRLVLQSRSVVEGTLAGRHRSSMKGVSSEFAEHRAYIAGDDPKHIDWKVLGRTDRYYVRRYQDETNLRVYLVVDRSGSMGYTSHGRTKYQYACRLAAAIGYVVVKAKDSIGLYLYSENLDGEMGAKNSFAHLHNALEFLHQQKPAGGTHTAQTLHRIADNIRRRALIVLCSDLLDEPAQVIKALAHFRKQHHDVILFQTLDPAEIEFPFRQGGEFVDLETGERVVTEPRAVRAEYRRVFEAFLARYRQACNELKIDYRVAPTHQPLDRLVREYLEQRKKYTG
jgi:uncharacterized protein (DUF58 family)